MTEVRKWKLTKNSRIKFQRMLREMTKDAYRIMPKTSKEIFCCFDNFHQILDKLHKLMNL